MALEEVPKQTIVYALCVGPTQEDVKVAAKDVPQAALNKKPVQEQAPLDAPSLVAEFAPQCNPINSCFCKVQTAYD